MLEGIFKMLEEAMEEGKKEKEEPLGQISEELAKRMRKNTRERAAIHTEMDLFMQEKAHQAHQEMHEKFDDRSDSVEEERKKIWAEIADQFGRSQDEHLTYDPKTKTVSRFVEEEGEEKKDE